MHTLYLQLRGFNNIRENACNYAASSTQTRHKTTLIIKNSNVTKYDL